MPQAYDNLLNMVSGSELSDSAYGNVASLKDRTNIYSSLKQTIPSSRLLTLDTVPLVILPAPGLNNLIIPVSLLLFLDFNTIAYDANRNVRLRYTGIATDVLSQNVVFTSIVDRLAWVSQGSTAIASIPTNTSMELNLTGPILNGDSPLIFILLYKTYVNVLP